MTQDEFVKTKVLPEYRDIVTMLRELMREMAPDAQEVISYGIPVPGSTHETEVRRR